MAAHTVTNPPPEWTTEPAELNYETEWADDDSIGQQITAEYGLGKGQPVMFSSILSLLMFEAGDKFYIWNRDDMAVYEVTSHTDLDEIVAAMTENGLPALTLIECEGQEQESESE